MGTYQTTEWVETGWLGMLGALGDVGCWLSIKAQVLGSSAQQLLSKAQQLRWQKRVVTFGTV